MTHDILKKHEFDMNLKRYTCVHIRVPLYIHNARKDTAGVKFNTRATASKPHFLHRENSFSR